MARAPIARSAATVSVRDGLRLLIGGTPEAGRRVLVARVARHPAQGQIERKVATRAHGARGLERIAATRNLDRSL
jgi:hypothetical protein